MNIAVSIIVPIYNVEKYLRQCVDSILKQTLSNIEIILVDDGSPDNCGKIADEYALIDSRIRVIHQNNSGLGPARNSGMKVASGEYIGFVDSDDFIMPQMYEELYNVAKKDNADIVCGGYVRYSNGKETTIKHPLAGKIFSEKNDILDLRKKFYGHLQEIDGNTYYPIAAWRHLYKRELIVENNLLFHNVLSEDIPFNLDAYGVAQIVSCVEAANYYYRQEDQPSITHTFSEKKLMNYCDLLALLKDRVKLEDRECWLRFKNQAAGRCRDYIYLINRSGERISCKKRYLKNFVENPLISDCITNFDLSILPVKQRIFHWLILHRLYIFALIISKIFR